MPGNTTNVGVNLSFNADVSNARKQIQQLQKDLANLQKGPGTTGVNELGVTKEIAQASAEAAKLQIALSKAINTDTGKLNLSAFNKNIKAAGLSMDSIKTSLTALGPEGSQAFADLSKSIIASTNELQRSKTILSDFGTTLKNTVKWQISSSMMHSFVGSISKAYSYAQDLNESLNNIRIVTGQSVEDMADFASEANKAAKALSTTTTAYADAALIFYQQGLKEQDVTDRTDTVIKLANVTKQSAVDVSSYMTAIWNNFYDGSESLEHYADVVTALGATTASSSAEISEGLEKFAAIGKTVGLSYEYATSALATVVASTRQSADIVGTAFKTIFSRLQGLSLGETLDDGVTLNKYSKALNAVGVQILDTNGSMRDLDNILDDLASKWDTLSSSQQTALAQTVAGTRQYSQLIALMNNWNKMTENLSTANSAEGTLQEQADIYAESWEAASKRVKASMQAIYKDLLDDKFFINITDGFSKVLDTIDNIIKSLGGMKTIIPMIGMMLLKVFGPELKNSISQVFEQINFMTGKTSEINMKIREKSIADIQTVLNNGNGSKYKIDAYNQILEVEDAILNKQKELNKLGKEFNDSELRTIDIIRNINKTIEEEYLKEVQLNQEQLKIQNSTGNRMQLAYDNMLQKIQNTNPNFNPSQSSAEFAQLRKVNEELGQQIAASKSIVQQYEFELANVTNSTLPKFRENLSATVASFKESDVILSNAAQKQINIMLDESSSIDQVRDAFNNLVETYHLAGEDGKEQARVTTEMKNAFIELINAMNLNGKAASNVEGIYHKYKDACKSANESTTSLIQSFNNLYNVTRSTSQTINNFKVSLNGFEVMTTYANTITSTAMAVHTLSGMMDTLNNPDVSAWQSFISILTSFGMVSTMALTSMKNIRQTLKQTGSFITQTFSTLKDLPNLLAMNGTYITKAMYAESLSNIYKEESIALQKIQNKEIQKSIKDKAAEIVANNSDAGSEELLNIARADSTFKTKEEKDALIKSVIAKKADTTANNVETISIWKKIAALAIANWYYLAIAVAIAAVVGAVYLLIKAHKDEIERLNDLKEENKELKEAYENAKSASDELIQSFEKYDKIVETLNECTEGTKEWTEALLEANNIILALLEEYPELAKYVSRDENTGKLLISKEGEDEYLKIAKQREINSQAAYYESNQNLREEALNNNINRVSEKYGAGYWNGSNLIKQYIEDGSLIGKTQQEVIDQIKRDTKYDNQTSSVQKHIDKIIDNISNSSNLNEINSIAEEAINNLKQTELENQTIADSLLKDKYDITNAGKIYSKLKTDAESTILANGNSRENINLAKQYLKDVLGLDEKDYSRINFVGDNLEYQIGDETKKVSISDIASLSANNELIKTVDNMQKNYENLEKSNNKIDNILAKYIKDSYNFDNLTQEEFELANINTSDKALANANDETLKKIYGEENFNNFSSSEKNNVRKNLIETAKNYQNQTDSILNSMLSGAKEFYNSLNLSDLTLKNKKDLSSLIENVYEQEGQAGLNILQSVIGNNTKEFADIMNTITWEDITPKELRKELTAAGIDLSNLTDNELKDFISSMAQLTTTFDDAIATFRSDMEVLKGLKTGDTISEDNYAKLSDESKEYYTKTLEGYKLITNAETARQEVRNRAIEKNIEQRNDNNNSIDSINNFISNNRKKIYKSGTWINEAGRYEYQNELNEDYNELDLTRIKKNYNKNGQLINEEYGAYDSEKLRSQLDILKEIGSLNPGQYDDMMNQLTNDGRIYGQSLVQLQEALSNTDLSYQGLTKTIDEYNKANYESDLLIAESYDNFHDLQKAITGDNPIITNMQAYNQAAYDLDNITDTSMLDSTELKEYSDYLQDASKNLEGFNDEMSDTEADIVAKGIMKMNKAIDTLAKEFYDSSKSGEGWYAVLKKSSAESEEYEKAMTGTREAVAELLDVNKEFVSENFVIDHLEEFKKAANGDAEAIDNLKSALSEDIISNIIINNNIENKDKILSLYEELKTDMPDIEIGATLESGNFVDTLNEMIKATGMTVDQVNALCDSMGYEAKFATTEIDMPQEVPEYVTETVEDGQVWINDGYRQDGQQHGHYATRTRTRTYQNGSYTATGKMSAIAMDVGTNGKTPIPKIEGVTKKASGSSNNYSPSNKGGGKTGGSSGGGSSKKEKKDKKKFNDEFDRFYPIKKSISDLSDSISDLDKKQGHLFGKALISSLQIENNLLEQQKDQYNELLRQQIEYRSELQESLSKSGMMFDSVTGNIANYKQYTQSIMDEYNAAIEQYNNSAQEEADKEALQAAEELYNARKGELQKYQTLLTEIQDTENNIDDLLYKQIENNLKAFEVEIELKLDLAKAKRDMADFFKEIDTNFKSTYKTTNDWLSLFDTAKTKMTTFTDGEESTLKTDLAAVKEVQDIINNPNYDYMSSTSMFANRDEAIKKLKDLNETLMNDSKEAYNLWKESWDEYLNAMDQSLERWNDLIEKFNDINSVLDHYEKISELLYGAGNAVSRSNMAEIYNNRISNSENRQITLRAEIDALTKERQELIAAGANETDEDIKKLTEAIKTAEDSLLSSIEEHLEILQSKYQNIVDTAISDMTKNIWGDSNFDNIKEQWEDAKNLSEGYYDSVQRVYQLESLGSKWEETINSSDNLKYQQELTALMDRQLENLEQKTFLSEKDIELAEKELEVYKAQIALEEAQNNKTQMKLVRGTDGNWNYEYVADTDDVANKEQDYLSKVNEWRNASLQASEDVTNSVMSAYESYIERYNTIMSDLTLSEEERNEKMKYLSEYYWGEKGLITKALEDSNYFQQLSNEATFIELGSLYAADVNNYELMTSAEQDLINKLRDNGISSYEDLRNAVVGEDLNSGIYGEILEGANNINTLTVESWKTTAQNIVNLMYSNEDSVKSYTVKAYREINDARQEYDNAISEMTQRTGVEFTNVKDRINETASAIGNVADMIEELYGETDSLSGFKTAVDELGAAWNSVKEELTDAIKKTEDLLKLQKEASEATAKTANNVINGNASSGSGNGGSGNNGNKFKNNSQTPKNENSEKTYYKIPDSVTIVDDPNGVKGTKLIDGILIKDDDNEIDSNGNVREGSDLYKYLIKNKDIKLEKSYTKFDTGGYTGEWAGGSGRIAMLHSKELVLNAEDTANMLTAISTIRDMTSINGSITSALATGIANMVGELIGLNTGNIASNAAQSGDNNVFNITAEFPNANDVNEIREAILSLPTLASQYLSRN